MPDDDLADFAHLQNEDEEVMIPEESQLNEDDDEDEEEEEDEDEEDEDDDDEDDDEEEDPGESRGKKRRKVGILDMCGCQRILTPITEAKEIIRQPFPRLGGRCR